MRFGISHDAPASKLHYRNTSGATEGSLGYKTTLPNREHDYTRFAGRHLYDFY